MILELSTPVKVQQRTNNRVTIYMHSADAAVKVQISADTDHEKWVDVFTQGAAGNSVYTIAHAAHWVQVVPVSGDPTGDFFLYTGHY